MFLARLSLALLLCTTLALPAQTAPTEELVRPSVANPAVTAFDEPNVVLTPASATAATPLALFLPGTGGKPQNARTLLDVVAAQGYRVIGLSYNDEPAAAQLCPRSPDSACFRQFHRMRAFGEGPALVHNSPAESIASRLASLLQYLQHEHPDAGWSAYLTPDGRPLWPRILVSGLSQGAGMAAFIAKREPVDRVVLFSSPWDNKGREHRPADWLFDRSATPPDRWWAERHVRENTTELIANAYRALRIPPDHILLFNAGLTGQQNPDARNPYHPSTIRNPAYIPQWRILYGTPTPQ